MLVSIFDFPKIKNLKVKPKGFEHENFDYFVILILMIKIINGPA
jgi:hypothetical protein